MPEFNHRLYLVTDQAACRGRKLLDVVEQAVQGGVDLVQVREKNLSNTEFLIQALWLKDLLERYGVPLIINDRLPIALACRAGGIHVGNSDVSPVTVRDAWPDCPVLGYSLESEAQLATPSAALATYLALSPVFSTPTKQDTLVEWGLEGIRRVRSLTDKPLVAIGSMHAGNAAEVIRAGADCLAVVSAICSADDPARAAEKLRNEIEKAK